ncbi:hypothetical protein VitviT2T_021547 [Vitis vinifera]|uniref:Uncharacterized protein n=1 Tax=Vitis vinifera TaxID=29760 RepID=A0ABY9D7B5_VITVI|nr:hypothetical protein VitviT2T_021547 [Vitis vinifera]
MIDKLVKQHKVHIGSVVGTGPFKQITSTDVAAIAEISSSKSIDVIVVSPAAATIAPAPVVAVTPKAIASPAPPPIPRFLVVKRSHGIVEALEAVSRNHSQVWKRQGLDRSQ